jgi:hypothetical protein
MMHGCTIINAPFILQGLALARSLHRHAPLSRLWVLCADEESHKLLRRLNEEGVLPLSLLELEGIYSELQEIRAMRSPYEYIATLKPYLVRFLLETQPQLSSLASLDADLSFFSDPAPIEREMEGASILLTEHRFPPELHRLAIHGRFNGGFVMFRGDAVGLSAVRFWCERVREWCADRVEGERRSNQKYLEELPSHFSSVKVSQHPGVNVAPWNVGRHEFSLREGGVHVDGQPLVFYHFHRLRALRPWLFDSALAPYRAQATAAVKRHIYAPYLQELWEIQEWLLHVFQFPAFLGSVRSTVATEDLDLLLTFSRVRRNQWFIVYRGRVL